MIEQERYVPLPSVRKDIGELQKQAQYQRQRHQHYQQLLSRFHDAGKSLFVSPFRTVRRLPPRYLLHTAVALMIPAALALSQVPTDATEEPTTRQTGWFAEVPAEIGPISCGMPYEHTGMVGDPPLRASDDIPMPISLVSAEEALAPIAVPAKISVEKARLRSGPGLEYDEMVRMTGGMPLEVIGRFNDWFQVRQGEGLPLYWVSGELVQIPEAAVHALLEVPASDIPAPPPPKVGTVREDRLNFRDGPGTNYVSMGKLDAGEDVTLVEQYQDWFHVMSSDAAGWVHADFLEVGPGILSRVPVTTEIPDPNPALVASVNENSVNLRRGPGTVYGAMGKVNADAAVDLLARHKEWFKVQLSDGTKAWVFSDLLDMSPMVRRRVPHTNNIPAPPRTQYASRSRGSGASVAASSGSAAVHIPASGDVASYAVRFVGSRYRYGGASPSGFDCSGFTQYIYRQYGVYLPHSAAAQYSTAYGAAVGSMSNLAPGDLMFFAGTYRRGISHVAIYIGGGQMVHAMTPKLGVQVSSIWSNYWTSHYYGSIRVRR
jgi:cell wall-associated NlpC family hydrolase